MGCRSDTNLVSAYGRGGVESGVKMYDIQAGSCHLMRQRTPETSREYYIWPYLTNTAPRLRIRRLGVRIFPGALTPPPAARIAGCDARLPEAAGSLAQQVASGD